MLLYHGTDESRLGEILAEGLLPRSVTDQTNWKDGMASFGEFVYLTSGLDWRYAVHSSGETYARRTADDAVPPRLVMVEVNVGTKRLHPDEDHLRTRLMYAGHTREEVAEAVDAVEVRDCWHLWKESLDESGSVAHLGPVRVAQVRRILIIEEMLVPFLCDLQGAWPHVSASGAYRGPKGDCCRLVHRWLWGEISTVKDIPARISENGVVRCVADLPKVPKGARRFLTLRKGTVVAEEVL